MGYGGSGYGLYPYGGIDPPPVYLDPRVPGPGGYGESEYGHGPYGSALLPRPPFLVEGGYGGDPYGFGPYGGIEYIPPTVTGIVSLDGFRVEIFFSEQMSIDAELMDPTNYVFSANLGGAPVTSESVEVGTRSTWGATSVILSHSGTTLGGDYRITIDGPTDLSGNNISDTAGNRGDFLAKGEPPTFTATPVAGNEILVDFDRDMLPEAEFPGGIEDTDAYLFENSYPVDIEATGVTHPYGGDASQVLLAVVGMTSVQTDLTISPAESVDYNATYLPDQATTFLGSEVGVGLSEISSGELLLTTYFGSAYGWNFADTSGRMIPNSSFRLDCNFDASRGTYSPPLHDAVMGGLYVSDGAVQVGLIFERVGGQDYLSVLSGAYSNSLTVAWSSGASIVTLVRNQKADTYALLYNGTPILTVPTASFTGSPTIPPGAQFLLGTAYGIQLLPFQGLYLTATQTVFSAAWNFLHEQSTAFMGFAALGFVNDTLLTEKGPLTKGWGDATLATKNDVEVRVNGTVVEVEDVNPYLGAIRMVVPIPLMPAGTITVEVDYTWFPNPVLPAPGYNDPGGAYNKWNRPLGRTATSPTNYYGGGSPHSRFPFSLVYNPIDSVQLQPLQIGHRYIGFEREYTASYNNPSRLLFNQDPHSIAVQDFERSPEPVLRSYEANQTPSSFGWELYGDDSGSTDTTASVHTLIDFSSGSYETGTAALYYEPLELTHAATVSIVARMWAERHTSDGVFSGLGIGVHNNRRLFFAGLLTINGLEHVGMLLSTARPHEADSWEIGPTAPITIIDSTTCSATTSELPLSIEPEDRFQVLSGNQTGVYTIEDFVNQTDGTTTLYLSSSTPFPANPKFWGNDTATATFEFPWTGTPATYRLVVRPEEVTAELYASGELSSLAISINRAPEVSVPTDSTLMLSTEGEGQVFWGSISRPAINESSWTFFRYGSSPDSTTIHSRGVVVSSEMQEDPQDDPNSEWFKLQTFGYAEVDSSGLNLLLKNSVADDDLDLTYSYSRVEPFFQPTVNADVDAGVRVESQAGPSDAVVEVYDGNRLTRLSTLQYLESGTRFLISCVHATMSGLRSPLLQGWETTGSNTLTYSSRGRLLEISQGVGASGQFNELVDLSPLLYTDEGGRIIESRLAVTTYTADSTGRVGIFFGGQAGVLGSGRDVSLTLLAATSSDQARVALMLAGGALQEYDFDWTDGEQHTYRVLVDATANSVTLVLDDTVQTPTVALTGFESATTNNDTYFGSLGYASTSWSCEWDSMSYSVRPPAAVKRTLGVWLGGDVDDITSWRIPRTDTTSFDNSSLLATVVEMDWTSLVQFRIRRDASWGVTVFRPDLPPPPYFTGDFATRITEPNAGWINVEYPELPRSPRTFGAVHFGALTRTSISQQRWDFVRYRLYSHVDSDYRSPQLMVYNQYNVITSGERLRDVTPEEVVVTSLTTTRVSLKPSHIFAQLVYKVIEVESGKVHLFETWAFDEDTQEIELDNPLPEEHTEVQLIFLPGKPVTTSYLEGQPLKDSVTLLNEDTPPVPMSQRSEAIRQVLHGTRFNDPNARYGDPDFVYNDPYRYVEHTEEESALYEKLSFITVDNDGETGLLSPFCDTPFPGHGVAELALEGSLFTETFGGPGSALMGLPYNVADILFYSGTTPFPVGTWSGPEGGSIYYPGYVPEGASPAMGMGGLDKTFEMVLRLTSVLVDAITPVEQDLEEDFSLPVTLDNTPPTCTGDPAYSPGGAPQVNGAALAILEDTGTDLAKWCPWGDLAAMEATSLWFGSSPEIPSGTPDSGDGMRWLGGTPIPAGVKTCICIGTPPTVGMIIDEFGNSVVDESTNNVVYVGTGIRVRDELCNLVVDEFGNHVLAGTATLSRIVDEFGNPIVDEFGNYIVG
jgi:hypothetical protein